MGRCATQPDDYDTLAARVEAAACRQVHAWHLQSLRYAQLPPDSKINGSPPWVRLIVSHGAPATVLPSDLVLLEQKSTQVLVTEVMTLLNHLGQVMVEPRMEQAKRVQTGEAAYCPRTCPTHPPEGIPPGDD